MSFENSIKHEPQKEREKKLDLNILSLSFCETIDQMIATIERAATEKRLDVVVMGEFNFKVEEVLANIEKIKATAQRCGTQLLITPTNETPWGKLRTELVRKGIVPEETTTPSEQEAERTTESVCFFVAKDGEVFAFPKMWGNYGYPTVHMVPKTSIGITICGEIGRIKPEQLDAASIIYNPSCEGDDVDLKYSMMIKHADATPQDVAEALKQNDYHQSLFEDEAAFAQRIEAGNKSLLAQLIKNGWTEEAALKFLAEAAEDDKKYDESVETRKKKFDAAVADYYERGVQYSNSVYVRKISDELKRRNLPIVRCDMGHDETTGVLNQLPTLQIKGLEHKKNYVRYQLSLEK